MLISFSTFESRTVDRGPTGRMRPAMKIQPIKQLLAKTSPENISDSFEKTWHQIGIEIPVRWMNKTDDIESVFQSAYQIRT